MTIQSCLANKKLRIADEVMHAIQNHTQNTDLAREALLIALHATIGSEHYNDSIGVYDVGEAREAQYTDNECQIQTENHVSNLCEQGTWA